MNAGEELELLRIALTIEKFYHLVHGAIAIGAEIQMFRVNE
jgi:hypothetical protein